MDKTIVVQPEKCTGCHTCELVCSFTHTEEFNPTRSRISVINFEKIGFAFPVLCQQCGEAACMKVCPVGAVSKNAVTGAMEINDSKCLRCQLCTIACPVGATLYDPVANIVAKCDLCQGDPQCVKLCPSGAISYQAASVSSLSKRKASAARFTEVFEEVG